MASTTTNAAAAVPYIGEYVDGANPIKALLFAGYIPDPAHIYVSQITGEITTGSVTRVTVGSATVDTDGDFDVVTADDIVFPSCTFTGCTGIAFFVDTGSNATSPIIQCRTWSPLSNTAEPFTVYLEGNVLYEWDAPAGDISSVAGVEPDDNGDIPAADLANAINATLGADPGATYAFVFDSSVVAPVGNVYADWDLLQDALAAVEGPKIVQLRQDETMPTAEVDLHGATLQGVSTLYTSWVTLTIHEGTSIINWNPSDTIKRGIIVHFVSGPGADAPFTVGGNVSFAFFEEVSLICDQAPLIKITTTGGEIASAGFDGGACMAHPSDYGFSDGDYEVIEHNGAGTLYVSELGHGGAPNRDDTLRGSGAIVRMWMSPVNAPAFPTQVHGDTQTNADDFSTVYVTDDRRIAHRQADHADWGSLPSGSTTAESLDWLAANAGGVGGVAGPGTTVGGHVVVWDSLDGTAIDDGGIAASALVLGTRTVNGHALSSNVTLTAADVGAPSGSGTSSGTNTGDETATSLGATTHGATAKTTPVDADEIGIVDSAASNIWKRVTLANFKAFLKTYFDTLYDATGAAAAVSTTSIGAVPTARTVTAGTGLTGGGDLSANRTLAIGDAELLALAGLTSAADKLPYFTGSGTAAVADFVSAARALVAGTATAANHDTLGLAMGTQTIPWTMPASASAGTWTLSSTTVNYPYKTNASAVAVNDYIEFSKIPLGGTYTIGLSYITGSDRGIYSLLIDGASVATIDGYNAGATHVLGTFGTGIVIAPGNHTVRLSVLSKNASSTNYVARWFAIDFLRTA